MTRKEVKELQLKLDKVLDIISKINAYEDAIRDLKRINKVSTETTKTIYCRFKHELTGVDVYIPSFPLSQENYEALLAIFEREKAATKKELEEFS